MLADLLAPSGIRDGDPQSLAVLCALGGSAVVAYCEAADTSARVADAAVWALAAFRHRVADSGERDSAELERLLLSATRHAVVQLSGAQLPPDRLRDADAAFDNAAGAPLPPGLARDIIRALVDAAPVAVLNGNGKAVREATEQRYARVYERRDGSTAQPAPAGEDLWLPAGGEATTHDAPPMPAGENPWVPSVLLGHARPAAAADAPAPRADDPLSPAPGWEPPATGFESPAPVWEPPAPGFEPPAPAPVHQPLEHEPQPLEHEPPPTAGPRRARRMPRLALPRALRRGDGAAPRNRRVLLLGAAVLVLAALAAFALTRSGSDGTVGAILERPIDTPFVAADAAFEIVSPTTARWAVAVRERELRPGYRWITLAAHSRNVNRANFRPRTLGYRLRTGDGLVIGPEVATIPGSLTDTGGVLKVGGRTSVHLGFQVPNANFDLSLEFDPGSGSPSIRVPLI